MWWIFNKYKSHLPFGEGPYIPGCTDVMTDYSKNGTLLRFHYPTDLEGNITDFEKSWLPWMASNNYYRGFSIFVKLRVIFVKLIMWFYSGIIHIPIIYGAKAKDYGKMKCIILSHGLGSARFLYSSICTELASRGFLVVAVEHRDESSCSTYYYKCKEDVENDKKSYIDFREVSLGPNHYSTRNKQVSQRSAECIEVLDILYAINTGNPPENILDHSSKHSSISFNLKSLKNKLNLDDVSMMGHSFGGATCLLTLTREERIKQGIVLDPWMFPIKDVEEVFTNIKQPILFINTQTFHNETNVKALKKLYDEENKVPNRTMYTLLRTTHENQCDMPFIFGYWLNLFMIKISASIANKINNSLILKYLHTYTSYPQIIDDVEGYLKIQSANFTEGLTKAWQ